MLLWTIQPKSFYHKLLDKGRLKAQKQYIDKDYIFCFNWMAEQMVFQKKTDKLVYPIWAWFKYSGKRKKPDLRHSILLERGTKGVCLEIEVPDDNVLLSQFDMWILCLNGAYINENEEEHAKIDKLISKNRLTTEDIIISWSRIFDLNFGSQPGWHPLKERWIQACIPEIRVEQIQDVREFTAR